LVATGDLSDTPAGLDPSGLQDNGGPTQTTALEPGSAAIDHVSDGALCPATDQRGAPRMIPCDIGAYDTDGRPAVVSEVSPDTGFTTGGATVTITGTGFTGASAVSFGGVPATIDNVMGDTLLTVTAPPGSAGTVDIVVSAPGGVSTVNAADEYTYTVQQTNPNTVTCGATCPTNSDSSPLNDTALSVAAPSGSSGATDSLLVNTDTLTCGVSKAHDYDYPTPVSTLSATGFATEA
jgi:hypothetical protein